MPVKNKKQQRIFAIYWFMLVYIIAALVWWYIELSRQNESTYQYQIQHTTSIHPQNMQELNKIKNHYSRKRAQYIGEGIIFFLIIVGAAIFIFRAVRRQFRHSREQQSFMMAITHELKTPLAIAQLNLETLNKHKLDEEKKKKLSHSTLQEINRLNALCNNLLISSQIEQGGFRFNIEAIEFSNMILQIVEEFKNRYPSRKIENQIESEITYNGDLTLLQIAINNLIGNAIKYSKDDIQILLKTSESGITFSVADKGPGISLDEQQHIFEKFYRIGNEATKAAKGTGLGLYLVQKVIQAHHGKITITNNQPHGTIFSLLLNNMHHERT